MTLSDTVPVTVYMAGVNQWAAFDSVPEAGTDETLIFYLSSEGAANTVRHGPPALSRIELPIVTLPE